MKWYLPHLLLLATLAIGACSDFDVPTTTTPDARSEVDPNPTASGLVPPQVGDRTGSERVVLSLESEFSSVGGLYFDASVGQMVVLVADSTQGDQAAARAGEILAGKLIFSPEDGRQLSNVPVVFQAANYPFSQLVRWSIILLPEMGQTPGWLLVDADERLNRVRIGIEQESVRPAVLRALTAARVPETAVHIESVAPLEMLLAAPTASTGLSHSLRHRTRPAGSGMEIRNDLGQRCSYGWTVKDGSDWGFVTAGHCSRHVDYGAGTIGEAFYQNQVTLSDSVGTVAKNRAWNYACYHNGVPWQGQCGIDAMWIRAASNPDLAQVVAIPSGLQLGNNTPGGVVISKWIPVSNDTGEQIGGIMATGARKVGRTTGYTGGTIVGTCEHHMLDGRLTLCLNRLEGASVGEGDSGGPVFGVLPLSFPGPDQIAIPFGITVAGGPLNAFDVGDNTARCHSPSTPATCTLLYAPVAKIDQHLNASFEYGSGPP